MRSCTHCSAEEVVTMSQENAIQAMALLIPILSVTVSLGALIVWFVVWYRRRMHEVDCRHKERMAAIEKGLELPPESLPQIQQVPACTHELAMRSLELSMRSSDSNKRVLRRAPAAG